MQGGSHPKTFTNPTTVQPLLIDRLRRGYWQTAVRDPCAHKLGTPASRRSSIAAGTAGSTASSKAHVNSGPEVGSGRLDEGICSLLRSLAGVRMYQHI